MTAIIATCARLADVLNRRNAMVLADQPMRPQLSRSELTALFAADLAQQDTRLIARAR